MRENFCSKSYYSTCVSLKQNTSQVSKWTFGVIQNFSVIHQLFIIFSTLPLILYCVYKCLALPNALKFANSFEDREYMRYSLMNFNPVHPIGWHISRIFH
jgi:hypothetical protein